MKHNYAFDRKKREGPEDAAHLIAEVLTEYFDLASPDDVASLRFQLPLIAGEISDRLGLRGSQK